MYSKIRHRRQRSPYRTTALGVLFALGVAWASPVAAQPNPLSRLRGEVMKMLRDGNVTDKTTWSDYYTQILEQFTSKSVTSIHSVRNSIKGELRASGNAANQSAHTQLNELMLKQMQQIAADDSPHSAIIRTNAMLLIAELNAVELKTAGRSTATPLPEALPILMKEFANPKQMDSVKVAALLGILRHAEAGIVDKNPLQQVHATFLQLAGQKQSPAGRSEDAHLWMRRRAVQGLGLLKQPGVARGGIEVVELLVNLVNDVEAPLSLRIDAVESLGQLPLETAKGLNYSLIAQSLGDMAVEVAASESTRRGWKYYLSSIITSLAGPEGNAGLLAAAGTTPHKKFIADLLAELTPLMEAIDDDELYDDELLDMMTERAAALAEWLDANPVAKQELLATN